MTEEILIADEAELARVIFLGVVRFVFIERIDQQLAFAHVRAEQRGLHAGAAVARKIGCSARVRIGRSKARDGARQQHPSRQPSGGGSYELRSHGSVLSFAEYLETEIASESFASVKTKDRM